MRGDELVSTNGDWSLYYLGWRKMAEDMSKEFLEEYAEQKAEFAKEEER